MVAVKSVSKIVWASEGLGGLARAESGETNRCVELAVVLLLSVDLSGVDCQWAVG